jgi:hypothetical protein
MAERAPSAESARDRAKIATKGRETEDGRIAVLLPESLGRWPAVEVLKPSEAHCASRELPS